MTSEEALAVSKTFTKKTVAGMGAVKGAPCQVKSIETIVGGNKITLELEDKNGVKYTEGFQVLNGATIEDIEWTDDNHLKMTLNHGGTVTTTNALQCDEELNNTSERPPQNKAVKMYVDNADAETLQEVKDYIDSNKVVLCQHFVTFGSSVYGSLWFSMKFLNKSEASLTIADIAKWLYRAGYTSGSKAYGIDNSSTLLANLDQTGNKMWWVYAVSSASENPNDLIFYVCNGNNSAHRTISVATGDLMITTSDVNKLGYILTD